MAQRLSISNKQALLIGLGATAFITGAIMIAYHNKKRKKLQANTTNKNKKSITV